VFFGQALFKTVPGRGELNANNSVDWDGTPTFYQATTIAHGHILYYKQIWKADGYSMGDLLYSLPLAPGQKKQVVIFDWDRTEYGRRDEATHEDEALNSYLSHNRDINDITQGTFSEQLRGGSEAHTSGSAGGVGGGVGALLGPVMIGVAGGYSTSSGSSSSSAWQDSSRNVAATGLNQLRDMVQQGASAVRNQRSTVVQTARQSERFKVETEVVANHNHCHAITVQYFEVLRHYAIEQKLTHVQECLFIPLLMSEFDISKIMRWRDILRQSLLLPLRRRPLSIFGEHPLTRGLDAAERIFVKYEGSDFPIGMYASESLINLTGDLRISFKLNRPLDDDDNADDPARQEQLIAPTILNMPGWGIWWALGLGQVEFYQQYFANQKVKYKNKIFEERVAPVLAEEVVDKLIFTAVNTTGGRYPLQVDTTLVSNYQRDVELYITVRPAGAINVRRDQIEFIEISTAVDLSRSANSKIIVHSATFRYSTPHLNAHLAQDYRVDNDLKPNDPVVIYTPLSAEEKRDPHKEDIYFSRQLIEHLNANLEYYHKVIWQRMDPDRRYMLLDGFLAPNSNGKSVASVVENKVIGVAGNSLIMPVAPGYKLDPTYQHEPERDDRGQPKTDEVGNTLYKPISLLDHYEPLTPIPPFRASVPTRGVFAEAVMGACNSCEKWEEERYWKWEEHPIPEEPTPIAPVETAPPQRTDPGDLKPSPFPTPMINIQNAPSAPEPGATLAGALGLLGKSDIFPNITGLEQNQKNALQAMLSNQESAKHFADKAAELAVQSANLKSGNSTVESIKKSMADGTLDKETGKKLIEDTYRAQIGGKTTPPEQPVNSANNSKLSDAAAEAVKSGREVKASQSHPDGTTTNVEQKPSKVTEGSASDNEIKDFEIFYKQYLDRQYPNVNPTEDSEYTRSRDFYTLRAYEKAFGKKDNSWDPLVGFKANRARITALYEYYKNTYLSKTDKFLWAGLGRMAGGAVLGGLDFLVSGPAGVLPHNDPSFLTNMMVLIGKQIFLDLAWQHELFLDDSKKAANMAREHDKRFPAKESYADAWEKIASTNFNDIVEGNKMLLANEQFTIIQPLYESLKKNFHSKGAFDYTSIFTQNVHPYHRAFLRVLPQGDVTNAKDRWAWIIESGGMMDKWGVMAVTERTRLVNLSMDDLLAQRWGQIKSDLLPPGSQ
jgi:hypothetical protein